MLAKLEQILRKFQEKLLEKQIEIFKILNYFSRTVENIWSKIREKFCRKFKEIPGNSQTVINYSAKHKFTTGQNCKRATLQNLTARQRKTQMRNIVPMTFGHLCIFISNFICPSPIPSDAPIFGVYFCGVKNFENWPAFRAILIFENIN